MFILLYTRDGLTCRHQLRPGDTVIGRAPICDLTIDDPSISRRHVRLRVHGEHCVLTDLGGRNGTFLNGEQVTEAEVRGGDTVVLGRFPLHIEHVAAAPLVLSEHALLSDSSPAIVRRLDDEAETRGAGGGATPERLLFLLARIAERLSPSVAMPDVLDRTLDVALETTPVERAVLFLIDPSSADVTPQAARARDGGPIARAAVSRTAVRRAIDERIAILAAHPLPEASVADTGAHDAAAGHSFALVPLHTARRVVGVLYADVPHPVRLDVSDLDVLQALGACAGAAIERARDLERRLETTRRREALERQHPPAFVSRMLASREAMVDAHPPAEREMTVLVAEMAPWTSVGERLPAARIAAALEGCLSIIYQAVLAEEGTIAGQTGGGVLGVFGSALERPDHADCALRAALAIRRAVTALPLAPPVQLRIALDSGTGVAGDFGPSHRRDYLVVGEVVRIGQRLIRDACGAGQIVLTRATRDRLRRPARLTSIGARTVDPNASPIDLFAAD